ncbi:MAG: sigma-70 family RNA polymerase sigma factor [Ruminococcus sp.]|nr:sigma-70 family RNA polymerase sigma factor [Ruminococcus sp.]
MEATVLTDEELALKASGDKNAVSALIAKYIPTVEMLARRFAPATGREHREQMVDDLIQEGLIALLRSVNSFDEKKGSFSAYAVTCMRNAMFGYLKGQKSGGEELSPELLEEQLCDDLSLIPENIVVEQAQMEELYSRISPVLSQLEWQVFKLYLDGMGYEEIARRVGTDRKAVNNAVQRVRRKLRTLFSDLKKSRG